MEKLMKRDIFPQTNMKKQNRENRKNRQLCFAKSKFVANGMHQLNFNITVHHTKYFSTQ